MSTLKLKKSTLEKSSDVVDGVSYAISKISLDDQADLLDEIKDGSEYKAMIALCDKVLSINNLEIKIGNGTAKKITKVSQLSSIGGVDMDTINKIIFEAVDFVKEYFGGLKKKQPQPSN